MAYSVYTAFNIHLSDIHIARSSVAKPEDLLYIFSGV